MGDQVTLAPDLEDTLYVRITIFGQLIEVQVIFLQGDLQRDPGDPQFRVVSFKEILQDCDRVVLCVKATY